MWEKATGRLYALLRWSERYTKTDMIYLASVAWWNNLNTIVVSILGLGLSIGFANLISPEVFGQYQYLISVSALVAAITLGGMNNAVIQSVARGFEGDLRSSVRVQLIWGIVPALVSITGSLYYFGKGNPSLGYGLLIIALCVPLTNAFNTYAAFLTGKQEFRRIFWSNNFSYALYYIPMIIMLLLFKNAVLLVLINLSMNALSTFLLYRHTVNRLVTNNATEPTTIRYGVHLSIMNAFGTVLSQLDSVLVFHFLGPVQLAIYTFASMLPERIGGMINFIGRAALPKFSNQSEENIRNNILSKVGRSLFAGAVLAAGYSIIAPFIFLALFPTYESAIPYTELYALDIVMMATVTLVSSALLSQRLHYELYIFKFLSPAIQITAQVILLMLYGIWGMLIAKIFSDALTIILGMWLLFRRTRVMTNTGADI